jgi:beta-galactosidase
MIYGVQYYPEQWPEERWPVDAAMMQRAGVNTVRMGEFAWSAFEPREGEFHFDWMDRAVRLMNEHGIQVIMCTCSRTPPPWVFRKHPNIANVRDDGHTNAYGQRYTIGLAHPEFIALAQRIDRAIIEHYAGHPGILGWQVDNEVGGFNDCYCDRCLDAFRAYLRDKYGTVERLNQSWGANFWSLTFTDFSEVPRPSDSWGNNPQLALEYRRFLSGLNVDFTRWRAELMHRLDPGKFVTRNFQSFQAKHTDYFKEAEVIDLPGMNHYPPRSPELILDYYRGEKNAVLVLEQLSRLADIDSGEGWMRLWAYRALAHGARGTVFFRWRTARYGQEQHADGILPHAGQENRRYRELARMGAELKQIGGLIDATWVDSQAAILMGYEGRWALEAGIHQKPMRGEFDAIRFHEAFLRRNTPVDAFDPHGDLSRYRLVIAPRLWLVDEAIAANLRAYVERGGVLCLTAASGVVDEFNKSFDTPRPGPLAGMCGIEVSDLSPLHHPFDLASEAIPALNGAQASVMADEIHPTPAEVLATYASGWRAGLPALTRSRCGKGQAFYLGTVLEGDALGGLVDTLFAQAGIARGPVTPPGVRAYTRRGDGYELLFLANENEQEQRVALPGAWQDCLTGEPCREALLGPVDVRVMRKDIS